MQGRGTMNNNVSRTTWRGGVKWNKRDPNNVGKKNVYDQNASATKGRSNNRPMNTLTYMYQSVQRYKDIELGAKRDECACR
jgi:hypothetical protein